MLDIVNLTKIYKVKGGMETRALDRVTLSFPEKGMVFLLGKSGSGKSTLLNVCGGLDNPTDGEIIVKGRSSQDFSQGDFDSYRNTFIGFIFQEYNILNEFSVEDNIALALELQGKPKDREEIEKLLKQVDLDGYAKRKPNTLSGGQKQRIAIARALIKNPEIIMADEPTGALDSNTGKQVFETLKKLSEDKLVIVVSHDREFAEQYGDRIIELKDGKILSDVSKGVGGKEVIGGGNVSVIGGNTLCVENGDALTETDFQFIRTFLKERGGAIIASGEKEIDGFKRVNRITDDGEQEVFVDTDESKQEKKKYTAEDSRFIRSRLPFHRAAKIGVSGLKTKPIRLIFTILLCIISFTMFGLFSTLMLYDKEATLYKSMQDSNAKYLFVQKQYQVRHHNEYDGEENIWVNERNAKLTQADIDAQKQSFGENSFGAVAIQNSNVSNLNSNSEAGKMFQSVQLTYVANLPANNALRSSLRAGKYAEADDEIVISEYLAQAIIQNGLTNDEGDKPTTLEGVLNKKLEINLQETQDNPQKEYKIVGVFDCDYQTLTQDYNYLVESDPANANREEREKQAKEFEKKYEEGLYGVLFVNENIFNGIVARQKAEAAQQQSQNLLQSMIDYNLQFKLANTENNSYNYAQASKLNENFPVFGKRTPVAGEIVVTYDTLNSMTMKYYDENEQESKETLVQEIKEGVRTYLDNYLTARGYALNQPTPPSDPDMAELYVKYDNYRYEFENHISAWGGWLFGNEVPLEEHGMYPFYRDIFLPFMGDVNDANSYAAKWDKFISLGERQLTVEGLDSRIAKTQSFSMWLQYLKEGKAYAWDETTQTNVDVPFSEEQRTTIATKLLEKLQSHKMKGRVSTWNNGTQMGVGVDREFTVVGILDLPKVSQSAFFLDDTTFGEMKAVSLQNSNYWGGSSWEETKYLETADAIYDVAFLPYDHSDTQTNALKAFGYDFDENDTRIVMQNAVAVQVATVNEMVDMLSQVFMWVGIVMAVFSALLLSNFISVSISSKKKDIGILRAVGARGVDVFKIFFSESFTISLICVVMALVASIVTCNVLNSNLGAMLSGVSLFVFGPISIGILLGVAIGTAVVATFLPVYLAARKKPVESIRAL